MKVKDLLEVYSYNEELDFFEFTTIYQKYSGYMYFKDIPKDYKEKEIISFTVEELIDIINGHIMTILIKEE